MSICALVGATDFNREHFLNQDFDFVIAVDAGFASLDQIGIAPDHVVGDFDSLGFVPDAESIFVHPSEKDESDMELAIRLAEEQGCDVILLYGALAGRLDHTFGNIQLMLSCARKGTAVFGIGIDFVITVLQGGEVSNIAFDAFDPCLLDAGSYGRYISVFPLSGDACGVSESGLKYSLDNHRLADGETLGLSNEFVGESSRIEVGEGSILVIFSSHAWQFLCP